MGKPIVSNPHCWPQFNMVIHYRKLQQKILGRLMNDHQMPHSGVVVSCQFSPVKPHLARGEGGWGNTLIGALQLLEASERSNIDI